MDLFFLLPIIAVIVSGFGLYYGIRNWKQGTANAENLINTLRQSVESLNDEIKNSADSLKNTYFDDVTYNIFEQIKGNQTLNNRLSKVFVKEKVELGKMLASKKFSYFDPVQRENVEYSFLKLIYDEFKKIQTPPLLTPFHSFFIESGSSFAYLGFEFSKHGFLGKNRITTNNILVDQTFVFVKNVSVSLFDGTPIGQYGATFGNTVPLEEISVQDFLEKTQVDLENIEARTEVEEEGTYKSSIAQRKAMKDYIKTFFDRYEDPTVMLMTTSVLSLVDGPHVGSLKNRDFKEAMLAYAQKKKIPSLWIIFEDKIDPQPMKENICLSIFGKHSQFSSEYLPPITEDEEQATTNVQRPENERQLAEDEEQVITNVQRPENDQQSAMESKWKEKEGIEVFYHLICEGVISLIVTSSMNQSEHREVDMVNSKGHALVDLLIQKFREIEIDFPLNKGVEIIESTEKEFKIFCAKKENFQVEGDGLPSSYLKLNNIFKRTGFSSVDILPEKESRQ